MEGEPLLHPVMKDGKRLESSEPLEAIQERFKEEFAALDDIYKALKQPEEFPVHLGPDLEKLQTKVVHEVIEKELGES